MATILGMIVEYKAKTDSVDAANAKVEQSLKEIQSHNRSIIAQNKELEDRAKKWAYAIGAVVTAFVGFEVIKGYVEDFKKFSETFDHVSKSSAALGISTEAFQQLGYVAALAGVSVDGLDNQFKKLAQNIGKAFEAKNPQDNPVVIALRNIGLSLKDLRGLSVDEQYKKITEGLKDVTDINVKVATASAFFGKSYTDVLKIVNQGVQETTAEFKEMGVALTDSQIKGVEKLNDTKTKLDTLLGSFKNKVFAEMVDPLDSVYSTINKNIIEMGGMDKAAKAVGQTIVSAMQEAVVAVGKLFEAFVSVRQVWLATGGMIATNNLNKITSGETADNPMFASSGGSGYWDRKDKNQTSLPVIATAMEIDRLQKTVSGANRQIAKLDDVSAKLSHGVDTLSTAMNEGTKDTKSYIESYSNSFKSVIPYFKSAGAEIEKLGEKTKEATSALETMVKDTGKSKLKEVLGLDKDGKGDKIEQVSDTVADNLIKQIYDKAISGKGGALQTGKFDGKDVNNQTTTAAQDLQTLQERIKSLSTGRDGAAPVTGYIGAIDELKAFISKIDPKTNKVEVKIDVKPTKNFILDIVTSQENKKEIDKLLDSKSGGAATQSDE